jgi:hypothetical protein
MSRGFQMSRRCVVHLLLGAAGLLSATAWAADEPKRKRDLGDAAEGTYAGDVVSDSRGASQSGVTLSVTRVGKNRVRITSDYPRLPVVEVSLTQAMGKIVQARGDTPFVLDRAKAPAHLDVSFHNEVSWAGDKR